jgi:hypothetical protein
LHTKTNVPKFVGMGKQFGLSEEWIKGVPFRIPLVVYDDAHLQIPIIKEKITRLSSKYSAGLNTHPNRLVTQLSNPPAFRRLKKLLPSDLPYRFTENT